MRTGSHFWLVTQYLPHPGGTQLRHHAGRKWCASAQFTSTTTWRSWKAREEYTPLLTFILKDNDWFGQEPDREATRQVLLP